MIAIYDNSGRIIAVRGVIQETEKMVLTSNGYDSPAPVPTRQSSLPISRRERKKQKLMIVECPDCEGDTNIPEDSDQGDTVTCEGCGADLEVTDLDPLKVQMADFEYEEEDDDF